MSSRKPFRKILSPPYRPDHFTVEEARRAVIAVMVRRGELAPEDGEALLRTEGEEGRRREGPPRSQAA